jgi:hypothetical protein
MLFMLLVRAQAPEKIIDIENKNNNCVIKVIDLLNKTLKQNNLFLDTFTFDRTVSTDRCVKITANCWVLSDGYKKSDT